MTGDRRTKPVFEGLGSTYREVAPYLTLGFQLAAAVVGFFLLGYWVDRTYGTAPYGSIAGAAVGTVGGFVKFFRTVATLTRREKPEPQGEHED